MQFTKPGSTGLVITLVGALMLGASFVLAYTVFNFYMAQAQSNFGSQVTNFVANLNNLLEAAIVVMFLGIMGWVGSSFLLRGVDFLKVERGIGVVTFKVDRGVGVVTGVEVTQPTKSRKKQPQLQEEPLELPKIEN